MNSLQSVAVLVYGLISLIAFARAWYEVFRKNNPFGLSIIFFWLGIFVWGDALVLGLFWCAASIICFLLKDWILFLLIISIFWNVRSLGEIHYWISQQFSPIMRNPPKNLIGFRWFKDDSIWYIYQIGWQCILAISIITSIYLVNLWMIT